MSSRDKKQKKKRDSSTRRQKADAVLEKREEDDEQPKQQLEATKGHRDGWTMTGWEYNDSRAAAIAERPKLTGILAHVTGEARLVKKEDGVCSCCWKCRLQRATDTT